MKLLVVFDLDDTLYLERDFVRGGFRAVGDHLRRELGVRGFFRAAWKRFIAGERGFVFDRVLADNGIAPDRPLIRTLLRIYRTHSPKLRLCPDARRFLSRPPDGAAIAIITDGQLPVQKAKVRALGLDKVVDEIVITGQWGPRFAKPHPRAYRRLERRFRLPGSACLYVGDNPAKDFQAPRALGWSAIRMRRPGGLHGGVAGRGVVEIRSCDELRDLLDRGQNRERMRRAARMTRKTSRPRSPQELWDSSLFPGAGAGPGPSTGSAARTDSIHA
jgi:putative hydrolase of the HAD superfamily